MFQQYKAMLFSYLMRMSGNYDLSQDILQDTFRRYLEHYSSRDVSASLLFTIARNALVDHWRKNRSHSPLDEDQHHDHGNNAEQHVLIKESYRRMLHALNILPADEREVLSLAVSSELPYGEIASIMNLTEANVKVKIHRARQKLKVILQGGQP
jgi:RNA polymerase sigma-70 factor (ECF subfamily)